MKYLPITAPVNGLGIAQTFPNSQRYLLAAL
jgi:hypothetical protein